MRKIIEYSFYFFVFIFVFQTKLILIPGDNNYNEIAIYFNYLLLSFIILLFLVYFFKNNKDINISKHWVILAGLEFFIFISFLVSTSRDISLFKYILFLLSLGLLFLMTNFKFNRKKIITIFLIALLIQSFLGLFQFFSQKSFSNKYLGIASHEASVLGVSVLESDSGRFVRAYGATDHPNVFGALMFFGFILTLFLILKNSYWAIKKILSYSVLAVFLLSLIVSFSRSAFLALSLSLLFLFFYFLFKKQFFKKYLEIFIFSLLFVFLFFLILQPLIVNRFNLESRLEKISLQERHGQLKISSQIIKDNFWLGTGIGTYSKNLLSLNSELRPYEAQPVHNFFLLVWAEAGIWSLICLLWFLFYIFQKNIIKLEYSPLFIGLFVFMIFDHWLWSIALGPLLLFFVISLTFYLKSDKLES